MAINVTNKVALYNFLSTFSGTRYDTPRALDGRVSMQNRTTWFRREFLYRVLRELRGSGRRAEIE
jgi:hypothetical protein